ncbi:unannotated protein [freshwater metagenome]|uniref:Unannotated protein n=1 Tax=freshwater metagenome TaxID=449393 RepID=A0A6J6Y9G4_9ZZZZ
MLLLAKLNISTDRSGPQFHRVQFSVACELDSAFGSKVGTKEK